MKCLLPTIAPFCMGVAYTDTAVAIAPRSTTVPETGEIPAPRLPSEREGALPPSFEPETLAGVPLSPEYSPASLPNLNPERFLHVQTPSVPAPGAPENLEPNPNRDRFLQPAPEPEPVEEDTEIEEEPETPVSPPPDTEPPADSETTIQVEEINVTGSTVFGSEQLDPIVEPFEGQALTIDRLQEVADAITQLYLERGYITSRAILVDQVIPPEGGDVEIRVLEGSLEEIRIEGTRRVNPEYVRSRVGLGAGVPLNTAELEDQLRLLRVDPLFENVEASLRAGTQAGKSILIVRVTEADPFEGSFGVDNYSPPSVGSERLGLNLRYLNLTGNGDAFDATWYHTAQGGSDQFEFVYRLPVNPMNGTLQLRTSFNQNEIITEDLRALNIEGDSELYEISFRQPFIRTPREEFALSLGLTFQENQSLISGMGFVSPGANDEGITRTSVIKFGQDYLRRDPRGAWSFRSLFSFGTDWFDATENPEPVPDGRFFSWLGQVQRVQVLNEDNFLIIGADLQLTPNTLLTSQQFVVGGGQSLRGYRQNVRARDNGVRLFIEDRITLVRDEAGAATFQIAPFFDAAYVWNDPDNPSNDALDNTQPEQFLAGLGVGIIWEPLPNLNLRFDFAVPLIDIEDRGENAQDDGIHFSVRYRF
jgi:hemolysin activation/secretion protein